MPLDNVARRYAETLFSAQSEKLACERATRMAEGQPLQAHQFIARLQTAGVILMEALAHARADSLLAAYGRAQVRVDDTAVEEIFKEVRQVCEAQRGSVIATIKGAADSTYGDSTLTTSMAQHMAMEATRIAGEVRLKLTAKRDEAILDARNAPVLGASTNTEAKQLDDLLRVLTKGEFDKDLTAFVAQASAGSPLSLLFIDLAISKV
jgi:hypothetical protein